MKGIEVNHLPGRLSVLFLSIPIFVSASVVSQRATTANKSSAAVKALPSDPCGWFKDSGSAASKNFLTFDRFDKELRSAILNQDPLAMAFLVRFPLRVNDAGGSTALNDPAALKTHFQEVFTPAVRKEILSEKNENVGCNEEGIGYARGVIWVNEDERGYAIWSVNRDDVPPYQESYWKGPKINFVCQTLTHRIVVDTVASGELRYRAWNKPKPVTGTPDIEIAKGKGTWEGTQICAVPIYTFKTDRRNTASKVGLAAMGKTTCRRTLRAGWK